ncbi:MAG TPA: HEAT repeat domain-containing protein [Planctomycetota bacterium]|nr:HEAT repeat domain-containing protein [Planctomycetota bacterium]
MRRVAFPSPPISLSRSRLNLLVWTAVALGLAVSSAFADTIILKNGNKIHGRTTIENGIVRVDFGEQGRMSMPASEVRQIIEDDSNAFADTGEAAIVPAAAGDLIVVRLKEGADRFGRGVYLGWSVAGTDDRVLRLSLPEGGTMEILRSSIASIEPVEEASQHSDLTHLVTPFIDRGGDRSVAGEAAGGATEGDEEALPAVPGDEGAAGEAQSPEAQDGGDEQAAVEQVTKFTTRHKILLENGRILRGTVIERPESGPVLIEVGNLGVFQLRPGQIASIEDEVATVEIISTTEEMPAEPTRATAPLSELRSQIRDQVLRDLLGSLLDEAIDDRMRTRAELDIEGIEVGNDLAAEILYWVRELGRQRNQNRARAERHLKAYGAAVLPFLGAAVNHPFELTRRAAMRIIRDVGDVRGAPYALKLLDDDDPWVRRLAYEALATLFRYRAPFNPDAPPPADGGKTRELYEQLWEDYTLDGMIRSLNRGQRLR